MRAEASQGEGVCDLQFSAECGESDAANGERPTTNDRRRLMATTGILRSRRSAAQLHALASVEREIRANDPAAGRKYLRDFHDAYRSYERVLSADEVRREIAECRSCAGRRLPRAAQLAALSGLAASRSRKCSQRPLVLGVETIFSRDQHILDEWLARRDRRSRTAPAHPLRPRLGIRLGSFLRTALGGARSGRARLRSRLHAARGSAQDRRPRPPRRRQDCRDSPPPSRRADPGACSASRTSRRSHLPALLAGATSR